MLKQISTSFIKYLFLIITAFILSIVVFEQLLILFKYQKKPNNWKWSLNGLYEINNSRIYSLKKNLLPNKISEIYSDNLGFRKNPYQKNNSKDSKNIFFVGDSFTFGHNMKDADTIPAVTQNYLNTHFTDINITNAGIQGYGLDQEFIYIIEIIRKYSPEVIFWNLNINDLVDANDACLIKELWPGKFIRLPIFFQSLYIEGLLNSKFPKLMQNSNFLNFIFQVLKKGHERYTLGCTLDYLRETDILKAGINKLRYFSTFLKETPLSQNTTFIFTIMPFQSYFDPKLFPNSDFSIITYHELKDVLTFSGMKFFDLNSMLSDLYFPNFSITRQSIINKNIIINSQPIKNLITLKDRKDLFLEDDFPYGFQHLSATGNRITGLLFGEIILDLNIK